MLFDLRTDTEFTRFKPSIIAAVGVVAERSEKGPPGDSCVDPILRCKFVDMVTQIYTTVKSKSSVVPVNFYVIFLKSSAIVYKTNYFPPDGICL